MNEQLKHIHHLRTLVHCHYRYECLDCGERFRILSGVVMARDIIEAKRYLVQKTIRIMEQMKREAGGPQ